MKSKLRLISIILFALFILFSFSPLCLSDSVKENDIKDSIIKINLNDKYSSIEEWIQIGIPSDIGISAEWYVLALSQDGKYNEEIFLNYESKLAYYLENKKVTSASTKLKFALALAACGSDNTYITKTLNDSMGKQGIISLVFGLHLINNGFVCDNYTSQSAVEKILELQLYEGGWALSGENLDVDVTSMVIQALAFYKDDARVFDAIERALNKISQLQLDGGDFNSFGVSNPESGAQLITALSSLNIDFKNDKRFIKNGNNLLDGILKYRINDGGFCHSLGGTFNANSTVQVFYSIVAYDRMKNGKQGLYVLDSCVHNRDTSDDINSSKDNIDYSDENIDISTDSSESSININNSNTEASEENVLSSTEASEENVLLSTEYSDNKNVSAFKINTVKIIIISVVSLVFILIILVLLVKQKLCKKDFILFFIIYLLVISLVLFLNIQTKEDYYNENALSKENVCGTVYMSIKCESIKNENKDFIPKNGVIIDNVSLDIEEGYTVYDVLIDASRKHGIHVENNGSESAAYIAGINYIYEMDYGEFSGWIFKVNGVDSSVGCSSYKVKDGDVIEWIYTLEFNQ